jgi:hypothetical protein
MIRPEMGGPRFEDRDRHENADAPPHEDEGPRGPDDHPDE